MNRDPAPVTVQILEKEFRVACAEQEKEALLASAQYLNAKMKEIRDSGKVVGIERIAVMAALNLAHELLQQRSRKEDFSLGFNSRVRALQDKIERALNKGHQLQF
ncbi:MAG TPA: cell division protein ZapA [Gammaproteobacteria bacterium]|nr:cell division protein ZapA [Gammaproteobacteria bacterium]